MVEQVRGQFMSDRKDPKALPAAPPDPEPWHTDDVRTASAEYSAKLRERARVIADAAAARAALDGEAASLPTETVAGLRAKAEAGEFRAAAMLPDAHRAWRRVNVALTAALSAEVQRLTDVRNARHAEIMATLQAIGFSKGTAERLIFNDCNDAALSAATNAVRRLQDQRMALIADRHRGPASVGSEA